MIRYLVFGFDNYYPGGGYNDILGRFVEGSDMDEMKSEALRMAAEKRRDYVQIADIMANKIIMEVSV